MDKRMAFNEDELNYDRYRPLYPDELFSDIKLYGLFSSKSHVLEIGIGTGQATLPFLQAGCKVTAVELGDKLSAFVQKKYASYPEFKVIHADFMLADLLDDSYDLIYCATAFHWLPQPESYQKIMKLLKKGGTLALFWNHPFPNRHDDISNQINQSVYQKYRPSDKKQIEFSESDLKIRENELKEAGFTDIQTKLYHRTRTISSYDYIGLLNTYSDHRLIPENIKSAFEKEMTERLNLTDGTISIYDTIDLYLARKP